jgi:hypothetical protein
MSRFMSRPTGLRAGRPTVGRRSSRPCSWLVREGAWRRVELVGRPSPAERSGLHLLRRLPARLCTSLIGGLGAGGLGDPRGGPEQTRPDDFRQDALRGPLAPDSRSVQASVMTVPWTKTRSPSLSYSTMFSTRVLNARTTCRVGSPSTHAPSPFGRRSLTSTVISVICVSRTG